MKEKMQEKPASGVSRRRFLTYAGALTGATLLAEACKKDEPTPAQPADGAVDLGSGDHGLLNYFYLLEQMQADFYVKVMTTPYPGMTNEEWAMLTEIRDHEIAHREFLKNYLGSNAIAGQEFDFGGVNFSGRESVWVTARILEEAGVSAYTGAASLVSSANNMSLMVKILAVEARHAAMVRNRIIDGTFADTTNANGADTGMTPSQVLDKLKSYLKSDFSTNNLPQN